MVNNWKRLGLAASLSGLCFGATQIWYQATKKKVETNSNETPLAFVGKVQDEIQRRPAQKLLWQVVGQGDALFNGEAIRTGSSGEVRIQFADSDRFLDLEPDSLIVLQKANGEIALDLMEGSIYVNANASGGEADTNAPGIVLNSAKGKVDISKATVSLSKGKDSNLQMQVLDGTAKMQSKDGETKKIEKGSMGKLGLNESKFDPNSIKILLPQIEKPYFLDPESPKPVVFKWEGFPPTHKVTLWVGTSRKQMKDVAVTTKIGDKQLQHNLGLGKFYWKLVATEADGVKNKIETSVYRLEVLPRYAPTVIFPLADAQIFMDKNPFSVIFRWQKTIETKSIVLEISKSPILSSRLPTPSQIQEEQFELKNVQLGEYYWRMSAIYGEDNQVVAGRIQKFTVTKKEVVVEPPPPPLAVHFTNPETQIVQYFHSKPQISLTWTADKLEKVAKWSLNIKEESDPPEALQSKEFSEAQGVVELAKAGNYIVTVAAFDKEGKTLGSSPPRKMGIQPIPLLKAPRILSENGIIKATPDGKTNIRWEKVEGAQEYQLSLNDSAGKTKTSRYKSTETLLESLMPGEYQIKAIAIDQYGREGEPSIINKILVPEKSALRAPALKSKKIRSDDE